MHYYNHNTIITCMPLIKCYITLTALCERKKPHCKVLYSKEHLLLLCVSSCRLNMWTSCQPTQCINSEAAFNPSISFLCEFLFYLVGSPALVMKNKEQVCQFLPSASLLFLFLHSGMIAMWSLGFGGGKKAL